VTVAFITRPNSWVSQDAAATTQLTYGLQLNPAPLTVSIAGEDPVLGTLEFVLTNPTASVITLNSVTFTIQVGTDGSNLTPSTATITTSVSDTTNWQIQSPGTITSGPAVYTLQPKTGSSVPIAPGGSVVVEIIDFPTVQNVGNTTINVKETTSAGISFTSFLVTTFPSGFYFNGLCATVVNGSQLVPVAQVTNGNPITLVWNSSVIQLSSFTIYYSNAAQGQQQATPSDTGIWPSPSLTTDTVFTVVVTVTVPGGSPLTAALSTSVAVQNPALIASSISVSGLSTLTGGVTAGAVNASSFTTSGAVSAGSISTGALTATGNATLSGATLSGTLQANAGVTASSATVTGGLTVQSLASFTGGLIASGSVSMLTPAQGLGAGNYTTNTDGFVIGMVLNPNNQNYLQLSIGKIYGSIDGMTWTATGGNVCLVNSGWTKYASPLSEGFCMPVRKGAGWSIWSWVPSNVEISPIIQFWWIPAGSNAGQSQIVRTGEPPVADMRPSLMRRVPAPKGHLIAELADLIDTLAEKPLSEKKRAQLLELLTLMNTDSFIDE
jgi:hypothetical protein